MSKKKTAAVTRSFLLKLANRLYDPKTKKFLRLCDGTLQNGPDPTDDKRPMHCGLGELWFAMTNTQPEDTSFMLDEDDVVCCALFQSPLCIDDLKDFSSVLKGIQSLNLDPYDCDEFTDVIGKKLDQHLGSHKKYSKALKFKNLLKTIPSINDDGCGDSNEDGSTCTDETFRERSKRVAAILRQAAKLLPA